ncbi:MAG: acylneuraminate cytidylyltransferase [Anaerolineaceae bacterium]|nr:acylneuraminate cytidylyltransferase [Anaerolineaceae bacterium]MBN2677090.1 acylneuraminate cytidylyltransferase [Anaerolineaceae bacterium]
MKKQKSEVLAIIPARGGSKGIPRKNVRDLAGFPLIGFSIASARASTFVTRVIVTTDDEEIAAIARQLDAEVPFMRPLDLAMDDTRDLPVFQHALNWLTENENYQPDIVVHLRPTTPTRKRGSIDQAVKIFLDNPHIDSVRSVIIPNENPFKMWKILSDGRMEPLISHKVVSEAYNAPRQTLPIAYWHNGQIDVVSPTTILEKKSMSGDMILPIVLDPAYSLDIDTNENWQYAEWVIRSRKLDMDYPGKLLRPWPKKVSLVVFDFDGVMTDNRVWVDEGGHEMVAANRSDSYSISRLRAQSIPLLVISTETNPVVEARCRKMKIDCIQGVKDKAMVLKDVLESKRIAAHETIFVGNDINDLGCFELVGFAVAVADALPEVVSQADMVLTHKGGHGAVREICELVLDMLAKN